MVGDLPADERPAGSIFGVAFSEERVTFSRQDGDIHTTLEVVVSTEDDAEVRRLTISNNGERTREIEVTSYAEIAIASQADDVAHPAFVKMFVETEYVARFGAILATRRRRSPEQREVWAAHHSVASGEGVGKAEFETDRARFLGRGLGVRTRPRRSTAAFCRGRPEPCSIRSSSCAGGSASRRARPRTSTSGHWSRVAGKAARRRRQDQRYQRVRPGGHARLDPGPSAAPSSRHRAGTRQQFQRLAGASHLCRVGRSAILGSDHARRRTAIGLWPQSILGDLPIILLRIANVEDIRIVHQLLRAMEYWRARRLEVDLAPQ